jgi:nucleotide-binding universal stress UspA family protein
MRIRKILVPIDFSEGARHAMHEALDLAVTLGAEVTLLHTYVIPSYALPDGSVVMTTAQAYSEIVARADAELLRAAEDAKFWRVPVSTRTEEGAPADAIVRVAGEGGYDLVVMGTHGRTGLKHFIMGSVAERVVRLSAIPVLTVRERRAPSAHATPPIL